MRTHNPKLTTAETLSLGLAELNLVLAPSRQVLLIAYVDLLAKWNRSYNLTSVREPAHMVTRHLLDSLAATPFIEGARVLDVGAGAGLPGIPLAIALPQVRFVLIDSNAKKTRFMTQAIAELGLGNIAVIQARVEAYPVTEGYDTVITRAFSSMPRFVELAGRLCRPGGVLLAMKGKLNAAETSAALSSGYTLERVNRLRVPGLAEERHLICIRRIA